MKKLLLLPLVISGTISFSFAGIFYSGSTTSNFEDIILDEGLNQVGPHNNKYLKVWGTGTYSTLGLTPSTNAPASYPSSSSLQITCKNGKIIKVESSYSSASNTLIGNIESVKITYGTGATEDSIEGYFTVKCKPITNPTKLVNNISDLNLQSISIKPETLTENNLSKAFDPQITQDKVENHLLPEKDVSTQPSFIDILYLQLLTIGNLSDNLITLHPDLAFSGLFESPEVFTAYTNWLNKFSGKDTKQDFIDTFSGNIGLKDIGIASDIIYSLLNCLNNSSCNITFKHLIDNKYDTYTLKEIYNILYSGNNHILSGAITYYNNIASQCSASASDSYLNTLISNLCNQIKSENIDPNESYKFDLGFSLGVRINNLKNLQQSLKGEEANLKGIFNIFWEMTNLTLGTDYITKIKKINTITGTTGAYEEFQQIFQKELDYLQKQPIDNTYTLQEQIAKTQTILEVLDPNFSILEELKSNNIDITNDNNFEYTSGVVIVGGIDYTSVGGGYGGGKRGYGGGKQGYGG